MQIDRPTYLIAELGGDVIPVVSSLRNRFSPSHILWPVDVTITGSSGIGTIKEGQNVNMVVEYLEPIVIKHSFTDIKLRSIARFPNTGNYYFAPQRENFDILHRAVATSKVLFNANRWPYTPHCTLRSGPDATDECDALFRSMDIPSNVTIECFSLYQPEPYGGLRVHQF